MALPVVLVEIAPLEPPAELASTLIAACSQAMRSADCVLADEAHGREAWGIAIVSWRNEEETRVWVEVGQRGAERDRWRSRWVRFRVDDSREERWRAVGFTIATLAENTDASEEPHQDEPPPEGAPAPDRLPPPDTDSAAPTAGTAPAAPPNSTVRRSPIWIGVGVLAGPGLENGSWRWGGTVRASAAPSTLPVFGTASARASLGDHPRSVSATWAGFTLGLGAVSTIGSLRMDLRGELLLENLRAVVTDPDTGRSDDGNQWTSGASVGAQAGWPAEGTIGLTLGADAWRLREGVGVWVGDSRVTGWPVWGWSLAAGAEWRIP